MNDVQSSDTKMVLSATPKQVELYRELCSHKPYRKQLQILVVEDQVFSQRLLYDILRGMWRTNNQMPALDTAVGVQDGWRLYLERAPDIAFIDLGLIDGSGHMLAQAIKQIDPASCAIIVTARGYPEEIAMARRNNVDDFIVKPYNRKKIIECVDRYVAAHDTQNSCPLPDAVRHSY